MKPGAEQRSVVLFPDTLVLALQNEPGGRAILRHWRDGRVRLVLNRELLQVYLKLLARLGVPEAILRKWVWWFTAEATSTFLVHEIPPTATVVELCNELARASGARVVFGRASIEEKWPPADDRKRECWISALALAEELSAAPNN